MNLLSLKFNLMKIKRKQYPNKLQLLQHNNNTQANQILQLQNELKANQVAKTGDISFKRAIQVSGKKKTAHSGSQDNINTKQSNKALNEIQELDESQQQNKPQSSQDNQDQQLIQEQQQDVQQNQDQKEEQIYDDQENNEEVADFIEDDNYLN